jgi:MFS family permease
MSLSSVNKMSAPLEKEKPFFWTRQVLRSYFARRIVYAWERPSIMRKHIYTGAMGSIWASLIGGIFFVYFGTAIGMSRFQWGLMGGISSWLIATQLLSAFVTERTGRRKVIWFIFAVMDRGLRMGGILFAFWLWQKHISYGAVVLIASVALANFFGTMASPPWMSWLADIIPEKHHGTFWGRRTAWIAFSTIAVVLAAGFIADRIPTEHKLQTVMLIFMAATIIGIVDLAIHGTIPEPTMAMPKRDGFWAQILKPMKDRRFRPWLTFNACWTFAMTLGGSLVTIYFLEELGIKKNFLGGMVVITTVTLLGSLVTGKWSGTMVDRLGTRTVLFRGHVFWATLPLFWLVASPTTALIWVGASSLVGGISTTAATSAANKLITRLPPAENRAMYVAVSTSVGSIAAGFGVITAGIVLGWLENWHVVFAGHLLGGFHVLFIVSFCFRALCTALLIPRIPDYGNSRG